MALEDVAWSSDFSKARMEQPKICGWIEDSETTIDSNSLLVSNNSETDEDETSSNRKKNAPVHKKKEENP